MLRPNSSSIEPDETGYNHTPPSSEIPTESPGVDIQQELSLLEEMILDSPRLPLFRRTLVDEEKLLDQLDVVRLHLPTAFAEAAEIAQQREEILLQAEDYGQQLVDAAAAKAAQILNETGIIQEAERAAKLMHQQVQQECQQLREETLAEIERIQRTSMQELEEMQRIALADAQQIQDGADDYADRVLGNIEQQLNDMLRVIRNGRQQLEP
ncbi:MAG: DivIVA domain-containing protein [Nostocaceae cyanobacterium]|nr:DivIVA domain-containing protein [Nostocaceae cyanobacterium]